MLLFCFFNFFIMTKALLTVDCCLTFALLMSINKLFLFVLMGVLSNPWKVMLYI